MIQVRSLMRLRPHKLRWLCLFMLLAAAVLLSQSPFLELSGRRLQANFNKTRLGMTRAEVETILGEPQGGSSAYMFGTWEDAYFIARLRFDKAGRLCHVWSTQKHRDNPVTELLKLPPRLLDRWW